MPTDPLRLALVQASAVPGDVDANVRAAAGAVSAAAARGARLVVFPELFLTGYELAILEATPGAWLEEHDARLEPVRRVCSQRGTTAILGAALRTRANERFIAAPVIGPSGDVAVSLKEYLHGSEAQLFQAGAAIPPITVVGGWRVAIGICFDVARPEHAERAALDGADLYAVSALYTRGEERRSDLHLGARAMDNRVFTGLANYAGSTGGRVSCGLSGAWGPSGEMIERASGAEEALVVVDLDPAQLEAFRGPQPPQGSA